MDNVACVENDRGAGAARRMKSANVYRPKLPVRVAPELGCFVILQGWCRKLP
jgi:hypothetical protein